MILVAWWVLGTVQWRGMPMSLQKAVQVLRNGFCVSLYVELNQ
jgi:hypothetical protein